ncbi:MAG TPA: PqqD family protein [Gammaproteobacteria bacterium]|nr:PqqD family protein [Gammaproteobacteria bacterium]
MFIAHYDPSMSATRHLTLSSKAIIQEINGELVILDMGSEEYFSLNEVGCKLWRLLESNSDLSVAVASLLEQYDVDSKQLSDDVESVVTELKRVGLLSELPATT